MAILPVRIFPDPVLRKKARAVSKLTPAIRRVMDDMVETMRHAPGTIGLAAPQIGHSIRLIVVDVTAKEKKNGLIILFNPVLILGEGREVIREGCLSLPDYTGNVTRFGCVTVRGLDQDFTEREIRTEGIEAICLQHEINHIDGMLFIDQVSSLKTDIFRRKRYLGSKKRKKKKKRPK